ncbi:MAG: NAD(P)H-hydrate epimerase [Candidatus Heimdallarchaeota archaeon]
MNKNIPYISTDQMREVDRAMIEDFNIELVQMMENAGRNLAQLARQRFLNDDPRGKTITVLVGTGGNGGGGLVGARHLHNWGAKIKPILTKAPNQYRGVPAHQLQILEKMGCPATTVEQGPDFTSAGDLIIDAIIGYSPTGTPTGPAAQLITWANQQDIPILSLDVPSGIDATAGPIYDHAIRATATMTLSLPKKGLRPKNALPFVGELYLADIGVPPSLYSRPPLNIDIQAPFAKKEILRIA